MDQSYYRFLFQLARKSKQTGLSKSEKGLAKRNATKISWMHRLPNFLTHGAPLRARAPLESYAPSSPRPSSLSQNDHLELANIPLLSFCDETRTVTPRFYMCFLLVMATQKYIFRRENLDSRSSIIVGYE